MDRPTDALDKTNNIPVSKRIDQPMPWTKTKWINK